ncbi:MAG TPA: histidine kinase N-terminal 7TM domain-containing protein [Bacillota bacterium]|nr:histidine kinase N-terminal 7TM domain-containing protein [Clostridiaceae bacterium]HNR03392.1 histidine kinase N-terminal 7TM domain-containing protein [Bacillota bacterium]HNT02520.1 histidine kinase N-terminal 7TM domain-containing protein [Bacillota bacterium]HPA54613.1 histidine kinase N-terminal 7TM domain-containing protein [Bacillota bacterium]HPX69955.1 histidine kinase N-terminal 7TM domain-containing protein [Bacillota bacterium]
MRIQYIPYIWPLITSAFISLSLGIFVILRRRDSKGAVSFILSMLVVTIWSLGNALEMASIDFSTKLFWANVQYFAYCYSPLTLLAMCMEFTGYDRWIRNRKVLWLAVIPTIIVILVWTDHLHGLIRYNMHMNYSGSFPVIDKKYGPAFYIHALYSHMLNILAWILLIKAVFFRNTVYKKQATALLVGLSMIVIPNVLYITGLSPIERYDITPLFFGPAGLIITWGIFRYRLFDVIPVARAMVIENMDAGVIVLDLQDRVLDINPAMRRIIGYPDVKTPAETVEKVCRKIPELACTCKDRNITHSEFVIGINEGMKVYEAFFSPLADQKGAMIGRLVVAYDITEKKQEQERYLKQQWKNAVTEERERLARDLHDNLGQVLGFINLQAQGIEQELINADIDIVSHKLDKLVRASQEAHNDLREYIRNARNAEALEKDFMTGLTRNIASFEEQSGLNVKVNIPLGFTGDELRPSIRINILNIVKEVINNIRKHSEANNVKFEFAIEQRQLCVTVEDDGKGFDVENCLNNNNTTRFGLNIIRERASEIGAQIGIQSEPGRGCRISLIIPLNKEELQNENEITAG